MKEFMVYVGLNPEHMVRALHSQLKDDTVSETFPLKHVNREGICFPTRFVKIVPIAAHGHSFHTSIWHVSLSGIADPSYVGEVRSRYEEYRETVVLRHVLKLLRQRRLLTPYQSILACSNIHIEHPIVTALHSNLVLQGKWADSETLLSEASSAGLLDSYIHFCQPHSQWRRLHGVDANGDAPSKRGGHAMALDPENSLIYLLGGWDGQKSLNDFWVYDMNAERWRVISHSTSLDKNGPVARSCHKMVYDTKSGCIYLLGRLGDGDTLKTDEHQELFRRAGETLDGSSSTPYCSEFYRYHTRGLDAGKWDLLSFDTACSGGPPLIFDHQMVMDCEAQILYVFGGRVVDGDWDSPKYSGLYSYNVRTSKWKLLQPQPVLSSSVQSPISPRFGHSMVLDSRSHTLFIFAGQRDEKYLSDMHAYDILNNTVTELFSNFSAAGGPDPCFTQRAIIDIQLKEIYVFCGLTRPQAASSRTGLQTDTPNWVYQYTNPSTPGKWSKILPEIIKEGGGPVEVPRPRYAHQVVYDERTKCFFMQGGNAGDVGAVEELESDEEGGGDGEHPRGMRRETRLDDFWTMRLLRTAPQEIIRRGKYQIRQQQFREMCEEQPAVKALRFLQTEVFAVVDHTNPDETSTFRALLAHLFSTPVTAGDSFAEAASISNEIAAQLSEGPPKKRSRPNTPDETWTSRLDDDDDDDGDDGDDDGDDEMPDTSASITTTSSGQKRRHAVLLMDEDLVEIAQRDASTKPLSVERFRQRTEVFESLLRFVGEDEKQPIGSLLDMVDAEDGL